MKHNPYKVLLWILFIIVVLVNSLRLFIYGFVISFIIVIIDRAFFGTRKRSDTQFLNLFFVITTFFAFCYTFSPYFRTLEFEVSHPRWKSYEIISIDKETTQTVYNASEIIEKKYTPILVTYKDASGKLYTIRNEVKHYGLIILPPFLNKEVVEKELNYIHQRSLDKLINKRSIHVFQHPHKPTLKVFKGNDAFALRHSIGFQISMFIIYLLCFVLSAQVLIFNKRFRTTLRGQNLMKHKSIVIILGILAAVYVLLIITAAHYIKFLN